MVVAESNLRSAENMLSHAEMMAESGYVSELDVEEKEFAVTQAKLDLEVKKTQIDVLKRFTKAEQLETLKGNLAATKANHAANVERAMADASRRDRALEEFEHCVVKAERGGLVIHPSAAKWENAPEIAEGATVHKDQVLLLMPDLSKMQVKVGIHESVIDRMQAGAVRQSDAAGQDARRYRFLRGLGHPAGGLVDRKRSEIRHDHSASFGGRTEARHERGGGSAHRSARERADDPGRRGRGNRRGRLLLGEDGRGSRATFARSWATATTCSRSSRRV